MHSRRWKKLFEAVSRKDVSNNSLQQNFNVKSLNSGSLQCLFHYQPRSSYIAQTSMGGGGGGGGGPNKKSRLFIEKNKQANNVTDKVTFW